MKRWTIALVLFVFMGGVAVAEDCKSPEKSYSKEFERMKSLEGEWKGTSVEEGKESTAAVKYEITSGGTAVVETLFPGGEHEMVSVYHDEGGKLSMTHYCMLGNRPKLSLVKSSPSELTLDFAKDNKINPKTEDHMHSLRIVFADENNLVQEWGGVVGGKAKQPTVFKLTRVK